jgi:hopanoid-associated phosphorylase
VDRDAGPVTGFVCGIVCGLVSEAALLVGKRVLVRPVAGSAARATEEVRALAQEGVRAAVSFGLAGGLAADLPPGTLIVAASVIADGDVICCDPRLRQSLEAALPDARTGTVAGSDTAILDPADKAALAARTGALAVDMESHAVARAARDLGLPFAVLRAVADPAGRAIPPLALRALRADGTTGAWPVVKGLILRPWLVPAMMRIAADSKVAHRALEGAVAAGAVEALLEAVPT